ncbi:transporter [Luteolibacter sp. LG18]|uniref:transporter n=1 Tax=Luteolibacter sp. LG18 TaxID=2819286 RepID=UPI002B289F72|nr:hypothetical protein llg_27150 [Luteolibacter sp. LG18]
MKTQLIAAAACLPMLCSAESELLSNMFVFGKRQPQGGSGMAEEAPGAYDQPEWLGSRRFATTRAYIQQDPWEVGVEQWWRSRSDGGEWSHLFQEELEIGLPYRFQLDVYADWTLEDGDTDYKDTAVELRWALANWGKIPLNPTLYFEYKWVDADRGGNVVEPKILLSEDFGCGWHWAMNFVWEKELTDSQSEEWAVTQAISKTLIDSKLSVGLEMTYKWETSIGSRDNPESQFNIGPSIQWRPTTNSHVDVVTLFGTTEDGPDFEGWLVLGWDFGSGTHEDKAFAPVTRRQ